MAGKKPHKIRAISPTDTFDKDLAKVTKSGVHDLTRLNQFLGDLVAHSPTLVADWADHALNADRKKGIEAGDRDAHLKGDLVLLYRLDDYPGQAGWEVVTLLRIGTHSALGI